MRKQDYYEPIIGRESEPRRRPKKKKKRANRGERVVVTLLSLLFLTVAIVATVKYVVRAPEPVTDNEDQQTQQDGTAEDSDAIQTISNGKERKKYCYTILAYGVDNDAGGSDTNILVRFDVPNKRIDLVSLPRDTLLHNEYRNNKLNFAYAKGGTELLMEQIENLLGIPVDFYVTVNLKGFIALVDQIDGVDFDIPINMDYDDPYQDLHIHFTKGPRHLNGQEAMEVVRFRHNNDGTGYGTEDIGRIGTQQAFLKAVAKQLLQIGNVKNIPALVDIFYTYVKTDLTTGNLVWLGNEALNIGTENIHFATLPGDGSGYYNKQSVYVLDAQATCDLVNEALNPYNEALTLEDMDILVP